ncbi:MAG: 1-(5-phosphoribosyl)-5-[(5-phosphoribosylamino)methylideneamino] imidazole-4-carboxamide isomerase [Rhodobacteraceae bacterium]|nr:1-(5-phosphoribosyl)-5-[(5-phosphoribosylamino)methylideneamino] imidazole-4-carboxamide isomerase [Paracoccaceae bacterium]
MMIYPTIELQNGRCVSLFRGRLDEPQIWHVDPVAKAREFAEAGAEWLQITDFDAVEGHMDNADLVEEMMRAFGRSVQIAGGVRTRERAEAWLDRGAARVVIGSLAVRDPALVKQIAKYHPDTVVLAVDVWQGRVMTEGWRSSSAFTPEEFMAEFEGTPLAAFLVTDIDNDVAEADSSLALVSRLAEMTRTPVIASGIVRSLDDIARLKYVGNVDGVIVGRALFRRDFTLEEAMTTARREPEKTAEFI